LGLNLTSCYSKLGQARAKKIQGERVEIIVKIFGDPAFSTDTINVPPGVQAAGENKRAKFWVELSRDERYVVETLGYGRSN